MRSYSTTAFVKQFNIKNATAFFTNVFKRKAALNKGSLFYISAPVVVHKTTNASPFEVVYGFNPVTPLDLLPLPNP